MGAVFIHQLKQKKLFNCCIVNLGKGGLCDSVLGITNTVKLSHTMSHTVNHTLSYTTHTYKQLYNTHTHTQSLQVQHLKKEKKNSTNQLKK